ncbi:MAG: ParB/RepB/Spo0J family partition protein [Bacteroidota bacterium]
MIKRSALGKGLGALLEDARTDITSANSSATVGSVVNILLSQIETNPFQPRSEFEKQSLLELAQSIKEYGIIQPITVRKMGYDKFQIISGERRFRASQVAGIKHIPSFIRLANDSAMLEMALVENIQREDLNAIEIGLSYKRLIDDCNLTQEELGKKVGQSRSTITNFLRLLKLPASIQIAVRDKKISMSHARTLLSLDDEAIQLKIFNKLLKNEISVRNIEELVRNVSGKNKRTNTKRSGRTVTALSFHEQQLQKNISELLSTNVRIEKQDDGEGKIIIDFKNNTQFNKIISILNL